MIYAFDDRRLDTDACELRVGDQVVPMEPQTYAVLVLLVEHPDRVVTKEELLDTVWGSRFVSESALTTRIKQARQAIGDDGRAQRLIRTVHGRGYRFVGELAAVGRPGGGATAELAPVAPSLLERTDELEALRAALQRAVQDGRGSVVLVAGEAGMGKTSLIRAFHAAGGCDRLLLGGCDDLVSPRALGPLRDIARAHGGALADAFDEGGDPDAVLGATLDLLADGPTVIAIEDLHWADDATLDLVRLVARRIESLPAVLVLTYRHDEIVPDHPLRRVLGSLGGSHVARVELTPLSPLAVAELAGTSERPPEEIYDATGGNPFFVTEILASPDEDVPATVRDAVLSRLSVLSGPSRTVVESLSVVPSRTERWILDALAPDHGAALLDAERVGVLGVDRDHIWFRHELARRAVEDSLPRAQHLGLHAAVLDALVQVGDIEPSRLVHHARHAGETDQMLEYAARAADDATRMRAYRQTIDFVDLLLAHQDQLSTTELVAALVRRAYALYVLNRLDESAEWGHRAVAAARDRQQQVDARMILSRAAYWAEGPSAAADCVEQAMALLDDDSTDEQWAATLADLARCHSDLATVGPVAEPDQRVVDAAARSLERAETLGRADLQSHALQYLGSGRLALGDPLGADDVAKAVVLAEVDPRDELPVRACVNAAGSLFRAGRLDDADHYVSLGLDRARGGDFFAGEYRLELTRAGIWMSNGRWDDAIALLQDLVGRTGEPAIIRTLAATLLARLLGRTGARSECEDVLAMAVDAAASSDEVQLVGPVAIAALEASWLEATDAPPIVERALELSRSARHGTLEAELVAYLRRGGHDAGPIGTPPGPWSPTLAGDHAAAAAAWTDRGVRYEAALEHHAVGAASERSTALAELEALGATATIAALSRRR